MMVVKLVESLARESEVVGENLIQCRFVHSARKRTRTSVMGSQGPTAWATARPTFNVPVWLTYFSGKSIISSGRRRFLYLILNEVLIYPLLCSVCEILFLFLCIGSDFILPLLDVNLTHFCWCWQLMCIFSFCRTGCLLIWFMLRWLFNRIFSMVFNSVFFYLFCYSIILCFTC
jgi:hypothetical protein